MEMKKFNTTSNQKTLVGNWYEDQVWEGEARSEKGSHKLFREEFDDSAFKKQDLATVTVAKRSNKGKRQQALEAEAWQKAVEMEMEQEDDLNSSTESPSKDLTSKGIKTFPEKKSHTRIFPKGQYHPDRPPVDFEESQADLPFGATGTGAPYWKDTGVSLYSEGYFSGCTAPSSGTTRFAKNSGFTTME